MGKPGGPLMVLKAAAHKIRAVPRSSRLHRDERAFAPVAPNLRWIGHRLQVELHSRAVPRSSRLHRDERAFGGLPGSPEACSTTIDGCPGCLASRREAKKIAQGKRPRLAGAIAGAPSMTRLMRHGWESIYPRCLASRREDTKIAQGKRSAPLGQRTPKHPSTP
jgi:hypothetical protein